jgi:hypothetical protein
MDTVGPLQAWLAVWGSGVRVPSAPLLFSQVRDLESSARVFSAKVKYAALLAGSEVKPGALALLYQTSNPAELPDRASDVPSQPWIHAIRRYSVSPWRRQGVVSKIRRNAHRRAELRNLRSNELRRCRCRRYSISRGTKRSLTR